MSENITLTGACVCGSVKVTAPQATHEVGVCHCATCRQWGGGPFLTIDCATQVSVDGAEYVTTYDSSAWAQRAFCKQCGSHLYYLLKGSGQYFMAAGLFANLPANSQLDHQVFIDEKPAYYSFAQATKCLTGPEVFAMFAADNDA